MQPTDIYILCFLPSPYTMDHLNHGVHFKFYLKYNRSTDTDQT